MRLKTVFHIALFSLILSNYQLIAQNSNGNWPNWRGPNVDGVSPNGTPPTEWSEIKNIKWKTPIPGKGLGTPVVWGNQIFITTAIELDKKATEEAIEKLKKTTPFFTKMLGLSESTENFLQFVVYSINRSDGKVNWKKIVREQYPHESIMNIGSWASASCVTDGDYIVASFGSYGIYCFNMSGTLIWEKDLGHMQIKNAFGEGISPVLYKDNLIIVWDHEGQSKIYVLNKKTGEEIWQKDRDEKSNWVTPIVAEFEGKAQIIVPGNNNSIGYDLQTGSVIWKINGLAEGVIPSPVYDGELTFLMSESGIQAVNLKIAKEDLKHSNTIVWAKDKNTPSVPSALLKDEKLYYLKKFLAQISCVNAKNGEIYYDALKLEGMTSVFSSPVWANGNIYIIDYQGTCSVIKAGTEFKIIASNKLDDHFEASPVIVGNELLLRGFKSLYCISK